MIGGLSSTIIPYAIVPLARYFDLKPTLLVDN
jgi:hypothetical protein